MKAKGDKKELQRNCDSKRDIVKQLAPVYLKPSIVWYYRQKMEETRLTSDATHTEKLASLSDQQGKPLLGIHNTVKILAPGLVPPQYVLDTLSMGPKASVLGHFNWIF